ncbi:hypothetical protein VTN77DRAFT_5994 [Rasamsonia byssochlamydoides]|uniref:uncharacterized protein n=1 Tax=Rasamsonia byssochlamydoides TaxID=89139 RepID=UPI00374465DD
MVENIEENGSNKGPAGPPSLLAAYLNLLWGTSPWNNLLRIVCICAAIGAGAVFPFVLLSWGQLANLFLQFARREIDGDQLTWQTSHKSLQMVYLCIAKLALSYAYMVFLTISASRTAYDIRLRHVLSLLGKNVAYFDTSLEDHAHAKGTTIDLVQAIEQGCGEKLGMATQFLSTAGTAFIISLTRTWKLTLVTGVIIPVTAVTVAITVILDARLESKIMRLYTVTNGFAEEALSSIRDVYAFNAHSALTGKYNSLLDAARVLGMKKAPILAAQYSLDSFFPFCGYALAFWYGFTLYRNGEVPGPGRSLQSSSASIAGNSLTSFSMQLPSLGKAASAAAILSDQHDDGAADQRHVDKRSPIIPAACGQIEFRNVVFQYSSRPSVTALEIEKLIIPRGKKTVIVGASGSGKSTIVALLQRWYDASQGQILMDGIDIRQIHLGWLRKRIGLVQQEAILFNTTVYEDVAHGLVGTDKQSLPEGEKRRLVIDACRLAHAHDFIIQLPQGYDTKIGERASKLSGGQRQRLTIERAIVFDPEILILDEATAALDSKSEAAVESALNDVSSHRTIISITHKARTSLNADQIIVMAKGGSSSKGRGRARAPGWLRRVGLDTPSDQTAMETQGNPGSLIRNIFLVFKQQRKYWRWMVATFIPCVAGGLVQAVKAILFGQLVSVFLLPIPQGQEKADFWSLWLFVLGVATLVIYSLMGFNGTVLSQHLNREYRSQYFKDMVSQEMAFFDDPRNTHQLGPDIDHGSECAELLDSRPRSRMEARPAVGAIRTFASLTLERYIYDSYKAQLKTALVHVYRHMLIAMLFFALAESLEICGMALAFW